MRELQSVSLTGGSGLRSNSQGSRRWPALRPVDLEWNSRPDYRASRLTLAVKSVSAGPDRRISILALFFTRNQLFSVCCSPVASSRGQLSAVTDVGRGFPNLNTGTGILLRNQMVTCREKKGESVDER